MSSDEDNNLNRVDWTELHHQDLYESSLFEYDFSVNNDELIETFRNVFQGRLNEDSPRKIQPNGFKNITLKNHQLSALYAMDELENSESRYFHNFNIGVLADPVGSGKSYSILAHLMDKPILTTTWGNFTTKKHHSSFGGFEYEAERELKCNLLVVSHSIYNQWVDYLNHTNLKYLKVCRRSDFCATNMAFESKVRDEAYQVVLLKANLWNEFQAFLFNDGVADRHRYFRIQRNKILTDALQNIEVGPDVYRETIRSSIISLQNIVKYIRIDKIMTTRLSNLAQEHKVIQHKINQIQQKINDINDIPNNLNLNSIIDRLNSFGDKFITESVNHVKVPLIWERIIIDEVDTIKISNCQPMYAKFFWFLTNNVENLIFPTNISYHPRRVIDYLINTDPDTRDFIPQSASGFHTKGFLRNIWEEAQFNKYYRQIESIFIRNEQQFVRNSFLHELVEPIFMRYWFDPPEELRIIRDVFEDQHREIIENLQAGNWSGALQSFADSSSITATKEDFLNKIREQFTLKINRTQSKLESNRISLTDKQAKLIYAQNQLARYFEQLEQTDRLRFPDTYAEVQQLIENTERRVEFHQERVQIQKAKINEMEEEVNSFTRRVEQLETRVKNELSNSHCSICIEPFQQPLACTPCCQNMFCLECITTWIERNAKCAICRSPLKLTDFSILEERINDTVNEIEDKTNEEELFPILHQTQKNHNICFEKTFHNDKAFTICRLIEKLIQEPQSKILLYSEHDESFRGKVMTWMDENNIEFEILSGSTGSIESRLKRFKEGKTRILLLNARHFGCGLNLQMTTDLIFFHRMDETLEKQILGRAQRYGRNDALRVHSFLYHNVENISSMLM